MPLTKKYYKLIAKVIKDNTSQTEDNNTLIIDRDNFINDLAIEFKADNHLFNRDKFIEACNE